MAPPTHLQEVWARAAWIPLDIAASAGLDLRVICQGLPFDERSVRRLRRVAWDDYCTCVERLEDLSGGPAGVRALTRVHYYKTITELNALAGLVVRPQTLYRLFYEVIDPIAFPIVDFGFDEIDSTRIRVSNALRDGTRGCRGFFEGSTGALEALPTVLGLPCAHVEVVEMTDRRAVWDIEPPAPPRSWRTAGALSLSALRRVVKIVFGGEPDGTPFGWGFVGLGDDMASRIELASRSWSLTPRQTDVLRVLAQGKSNKEIAQALDCAEGTVELHVTQILGRAGLGSRAALIARFWSEF